MALVVEDGTGKADAESYASIASINAYATANGKTFPITGSDGPSTAAAVAAAEAAARRSTKWLDGTYRDRFPGSRKNGREQGLEWPRTGAVDADGNAISDEAIPKEIVEAQAEAAIRELARPGGLSPDVTAGRIKTRARVEGAVDVTYAEGFGVAGQLPTVPEVDKILASLLGAPNWPGSASWLWR